MTVFENVLVGATFGAGQSTRDAHRSCLEIIERTGLTDKVNAKAGALPLLDRKRLELARASPRRRACCCSTKSPAASPSTRCMR